MRSWIFALGLLAASPALANDGFGGISATGLTFGQTEDVAMESEDLFISLDRIKVEYVFRNTSASDVTGEVIFPLPPISLGQMWNMDFNLPDDPTQPNLLNFTVTVDGKAMTPTIDRVAVLAGDWWDAASGAVAYDTPGKDVTAQLASFGIPLALDYDSVNTALVALSPDQQAAMQAAGLAEFYRADDASPVEALPQWSVVIRYHWTQTFPAGQALAVSHSYDNRSPGGLFSWSHPVTEEYNLETQAQYCIDDSTSRALVKRLTVTEADGTSYVMGTAHFIDYVLRTANSWAGPIGTFRLTVDKGAPENIVSLCAEGLEKTGPTTFVMEKTDYTPKDDLRILIVKPFRPAE